MILIDHEDQTNHNLETHEDWPVEENDQAHLSTKDEIPVEDGFTRSHSNQLLEMLSLILY